MRISHVPAIQAEFAIRSTDASALRIVRELDLADLFEPLLQRQAIEGIEPKAGENFDAVFQFPVNAEKEATLFFVGTGEGYRIAHAPMRSYRLPWPSRADFAGRLGGDSD